jgi:hypothetical protein
MVRFSMRPCPLSVSDARSISASRCADCRGGKAGLWLGEDSRDVRYQRRLVFLGYEDVITPSFDYLTANIALREHRIAGDDLALNRQYPQHFQSRLVFIGLSIHTQLCQGGVDIRRICSNKMNRWCVAIATPTGRLAVDRDMGSVTRSQVPLNPTTDACLEVSYIDSSKDPRVCGFAQSSPSGKSEKVQEIPTSFLAVLNDRFVTCHARKHGDDSQRENSGKGVPLALGTARIVNAFKEFQQRSFGIHASVLMSGSFPVINSE